MNIKDTPLKEKFEVLSYLQQSLDIGNYVLTYLKTKNVYQLAFINKALPFEIKIRNQDLDELLVEVITELLSKFYETNIIKFNESYLAQKTIRIQVQRIQDLEDKVRELEDNYSNDIVKESKKKHKGFLVDEKSSISKRTEELLKPLNKILDDYKSNTTNKSKSKHFTEDEIIEEIIRFHNDIDSKEDVINLKKQKPETYKKIRYRAYDRMYKRKNKNK